MKTSSIITIAASSLLVATVTVWGANQDRYDNDPSNRSSGYEQQADNHNQATRLQNGYLCGWRDGYRNNSQNNQQSDCGHFWSRLNPWHHDRDYQNDYGCCW